MSDSEDIHPHDFVNSPATATNSHIESAPDDSDDEAAWDEVDVTATTSNLKDASATQAAQTAEQGEQRGGEIEIVISTGGKRKGKGKGPKTTTTRDRMIRQERHKTHTICHLAVGLIRNRWLCDQLLQARLLSILPIAYQNAFTFITRQAVPDEIDRSRMFDQALTGLLRWWYKNFEIDDPEKGIRRRSVEEVEREEEWRTRADSKGKGRAKPEPFKGDDEVHSSKSLMKRALLMRGSRDVSAQLFTSLCRSLDIPARLVFSFQPIDWRSNSALKTTGTGSISGNVSSSSVGRKGAAKKKVIQKNGKIKKVNDNALSGFDTSSSYNRAGGFSDSDGTTGSWEDGRGRLSYIVPAIKLRNTKLARKRSPSPDSYERSRPPIFWTEVWTRANKQWITVDPCRKMMRCQNKMEPSKANAENQMAYVVAFEEDGTVRDVTPRYAKTYMITTVKSRVPSKKGHDWFKELLRPYERTFQLNRDRQEEEQLWKPKTLPFPTSFGAFKNHPTYVLEQHLHRDEIIRPESKTLTLFRGEPVYARSNVIPLKSLENYWREGRTIKDGEIPMKWVKQRTVTINRKRAEAFLQMDGEEAMQQGLYAASQTEAYKPPPVKDGKVPKNNFGNIDLFTPEMLPPGAIHIPGKTAAKCAKTMGIDHAEAITGFEFRQRRAIPIMSGIVVASEFAEVLIEAIENSEEAAQEKEFAKRQERVLKRWKKLIVGLRIRQRLQASYHTKDSAAPTEQASQFSNPLKRKKSVKEESSDSDSSAPPARPPPRTKKAAARKSSPPKLATTPVSAPFKRPQRAAAIKATPAAAPTPPTLRTSTRSSTRNAAAPEPTPPLNRSTTGRSLRFTMSTEKAQEEKEGKNRNGVAAGPSVTISDTDEEEESELELESDF